MRGHPVRPRRGTRAGAVRARALLALGVLTVAAAAGCGVRPSDVVQAGEPATGLAPAMTVYFYAKDSTGSDGSPPAAGTREPEGTLRAAPRAGTPSVAAAVRAVFAGPTGDEAPVLATRLPRLPSAPSVTTGSGFIVIRLPGESGRLSAPGMRQVVCTAAAALRSEPAGERSGQGDGHLPAGGAAAPATAAPSGRAPVKVLVYGTDWQTAASSSVCPAT